MNRATHIDPEGVTVIVAPLAHLDDSASDADRLRAWAAYEEGLIATLGLEWTPALRRRRHVSVLASHRFFELTSREDTAGQAQLCISVRHDLLSEDRLLAKSALNAVASLIFDRLAARQRLRVPVGPYRTAPYRSGVKRHQQDGCDGGFLQSGI